jgi:hypothetical protein
MAYSVGRAGDFLLQEADSWEGECNGGYRSILPKEFESREIGSGSSENSVNSILPSDFA